MKAQLAHHVVAYAELRGWVQQVGLLEGEEPRAVGQVDADAAAAGGAAGGARRQRKLDKTLHGFDALRDEPQSDAVRGGAVVGVVALARELEFDLGAVGDDRAAVLGEELGKVKVDVLLEALALDVANALVL